MLVIFKNRIMAFFHVVLATRVVLVKVGSHLTGIKANGTLLPSPRPEGAVKLIMLKIINNAFNK